MKYVNFVIVIVLVLWFIGAGCKPPEIEGTIVHMQAKRMQDAYDLALVAVDKYPNISEAWYLLGKIQGERGEMKEMTESVWTDECTQMIKELDHSISRYKFKNAQALLDTLIEQLKN